MWMSRRQQVANQPSHALGAWGWGGARAFIVSYRRTRAQTGNTTQFPGVVPFAAYSH